MQPALFDDAERDFAVLTPARDREFLVRDAEQRRLHPLSCEAELCEARSGQLFGRPLTGLLGLCSPPPSSS